MSEGEEAAAGAGRGARSSSRQSLRDALELDQRLNAEDKDPNRAKVRLPQSADPLRRVQVGKGDIATEAEHDAALVDIGLYIFPGILSRDFLKSDAWKRWETHEEMKRVAALAEQETEEDPYVEHEEDGPDDPPTDKSHIYSWMERRAGQPLRRGDDDQVIDDEEVPPLLPDRHDPHHEYLQEDWHGRKRRNHEPTRFPKWDASTEIEEEPYWPLFDDQEFLAEIAAYQADSDAEGNQNDPGPDLGDFDLSAEAVPLGALAADEQAAEAEGKPPPKRRVPTEQQRMSVVRKLVMNTPGVTNGDFEANEPAQTAVHKKYEPMYARFLEGRNRALQELRELKEMEERHLAPRICGEAPAPLGWATATIWAASYKHKRPRNQEEMVAKATTFRRFDADRFDGFLAAAHAASQELEQALLGDAAARPRREAKPISDEVRATLTAKSRIDLLSESNAASRSTVFAGDVYYTDRMCQEFLTPSQWGSLCVLSVLRGWMVQFKSFSSGSMNFERHVFGPGVAYSSNWGRADRPYRKDTYAEDIANVLEAPPLDDGTSAFPLSMIRKEKLCQGLQGNGALPVYISKDSTNYDMSVDSTLYLQVARRVPGLLKSGPATTFQNCKNVWDEFVKTLAGNKDTDDGKVNATGRRPSQAPELVAPVCRMPPFYGVRLGDLQDLVRDHYDWFHEARMCPYTKVEKKKTMYDVCPELIIPATTCAERIVKLTDADIELLKSQINDRDVLVSLTDLTIDPEHDTVTLGGVEVMGGMTIHGKLVRGGAIRRKYWEKGNERNQMWRTIECHGREFELLETVAPVPDDLPGEGDIGEASDRVWQVDDLQDGDTIVFRKGVSFIQMVAGDGDLHPLDSFASHFWGEETVDFLKTLENHAQTLEQMGGVPASDRVYYVCTFNNNQHRVELGSGWQSSPFNRALEYVAEKSRTIDQPVDAVMVFDTTATPLQRKWCVFEAWRCTELDLPLRLFCTNGEITRASALVDETAKTVLQKVQEIDVQTAVCTVKSDANMIDRAIEDSPGGFPAVHAKLRTRVLDLMTFIGSLAVSIDPVTGRKVKEVELQVHGVEPESVHNIVMETKDIATAMCKASDDERSRAVGRNVLLVAPAGSGKSVFSRALVRHAVEVARNGGSSMLPVRVPLAELAKIAREMRREKKKELRILACKLQKKEISQDAYDQASNSYHYNMKFDNLFDLWADRAFLQDAPKVKEETEGQTRLLILDGFDESSAERADIITWLRTYILRYPTVSTLLTTRPSGLEGAGMSTGTVRTPRRTKVSEMDGQYWMSLAEFFTVGTAVKIQGLSPPHGIIRDVDHRLLMGSEGVQVVDSPHNLRYIGTLKPDQEATVDLEEVRGGGTGGRATIKVKQYAAAYDAIQRRKKSGELEKDYSMTALDLIEIEVTNPGQHWNINAPIRLPRGLFSQEDLGEIREELTALRETRGKGDERNKSRINELQAIENRLLTYEQHIEDERYKYQRQAEGKEDDPEVAAALTRLAELDCWKGEEIHLAVKHVKTYVSVSQTPHGPKVPLEGVEIGAPVQELLIREMLVKVMGFSDFEIDTIDANVATQICQSVGGDKLERVDPSILSKFAPNLWDRPLMANLFAQFLESEGIQKASELDGSVAELGIFRFIAKVLIRQAARTTANDAKGHTIDKEMDKIRDLLMDTARLKMNRADRLWTKANLGFLYEDAVRGHLRLFEPTATQNGAAKGVQFYHFRIQELLAAESWAKVEQPLEKKAQLMVGNAQYVQTGLAPLRFLVQDKIAKQVDQGMLDLNFRIPGQENLAYSDELIRQMDKWFPIDIQVFSAKFPLLSCGQKLPTDLTFPDSLVEVRLDVSKSIAKQQSLEALGLQKLPSLKKLSLNIDSFMGSGEKIREFLAGLPAGITDLDFSAVSHTGKEHLSMTNDIFGKMPRSLEQLSLNTSKWDVRNLVSEDDGDCKLPSGLRSLRLMMRRMRFLTSESLLAVLKGLPRGLEALGVDFRFSLRVNSANGKRATPGRLSSLTENLPQGLTHLEFVFNRFMCDEDVVGIAEHMPANLKVLKLDFRNDTHLTDVGLQALGQKLPQGLEELELKLEVCHNVSSVGLSALKERMSSSLRKLKLHVSGTNSIKDEELVAIGEMIPEGLQELELHMKNCRNVTNDGIAALCSKVPKGIRSLHLNISGIQAATDEALATLASNQATSSLEGFALDCRGCPCIKPGGLVKLFESMGSRLRTVNLHVEGCPEINDDVIASVGSALGIWVRSFSLWATDCKLLTHNCLASLSGGLLKASGISKDTQDIQIMLKGCLNVSSNELKAFRDRLTTGQSDLSLSLDQRSLKGHRSVAIVSA